MLDDLLGRPESKTLDFKREEVSLDKALRTLVAFSNTAGGTLVLGVDDDKRVLGVGNAKLQEERYANAIHTGIEPLLLPEIRVEEHDGREILIIRVPRMPGPFHLKAEGEAAGTYVRLGSTNRVCTAEQREELRRLAVAQLFDERPCLGAEMSDLDMPAIDRAFATVGRIPTPGLLETLGITVRRGDDRVPSNGGIILFGTASARARYFGNARLRGARFDGTSKANILDRFDEPVSVVDGLAMVTAFVRRNTRLAARFSGVRREDVPEYGLLALREILSNAVAHADYSHRGMSINVFVYDDRIDVENPGGWPIGFSEEDFRAGISRRRNTVIPNVLRTLGLAEYLGSGYERIKDESETQGYPIPEWLETGPVLRVRMRSHPDVLTHDDTEGVTANVTANVTGVGRMGERASGMLRRAWFLDRLQRGETVTADSIVDAFGVTLRTARRDIADLQADGIVAFEGATKTGRYVLVQGAS